ncbi:MAG: O-antigen ligase family protein [Alphaproteobacteria bacterium]
MCLSEQYVSCNVENFSLRPFCSLVIKDFREAIAGCSWLEKSFLIIWLMGPFFLLVERSPGDVWLTTCCLAFIVRSIWRKDFKWFEPFWVKAAFVFWIWCLFSSAVSSMPSYSVMEAIAWFRFPLFAIATVHWFARDPRVFYAMLASMAIGLIVMCGILTAEFLYFGQERNRLTWPYGDKVPGSYIAKFGSPVFVVLVAAAVSFKGHLGRLSSLFALLNIVVSVITGERINFLIKICGGALALFVWKPKPVRIVSIISVTLSLISITLYLLPDLFDRFVYHLAKGASSFTESGWLHAINGGIVAWKESPIIGIGLGNYRHLAESLLQGQNYVSVQPHPHNYYVQLLCETGLIGLIFGFIFFSAIILECSKYARQKKNIVTASAWIVPLAIFWPLQTNADLFGQWNNLFAWPAIAVALAAKNLHLSVEF